jgi:hypothetical protein
MLRRTPVLVSVCACALLWTSTARAQDDETSLGDVARTLRKNKAQQSPEPAHPVIDNENLSQAIEDAAGARPVVENKTVFSIDPKSNTLKMSSPDATCSLSFNARYSSLLIRPVLVEDLPLDELTKIDGPGSIQDDSLQISVFNGTEWELREITIGVTLERKPTQNAEWAERARVVPAAEGIGGPTLERRSDVTLLYHLKTVTKAFTNADFHENIGITPGPDEDWRWSIVEAKGIRPTGSSSAPESLSEPLFGEPTFGDPEFGKPTIGYPMTFSPKASEPATTSPTQVPLAPQSVPQTTDKPVKEKSANAATDATTQQ